MWPFLGVTKTDKNLKFCMHSFFRRRSNHPMNNFWAKGSHLFWLFLTKNFTKISYMMFRSENRPFLGRNWKSEPTVLETLGNYLFKSQISGRYLTKWPRYDFRKKKNCFGDFRARNSTIFARCAKPQNRKKSKFGIFSGIQSTWKVSKR